MIEPGPYRRAFDWRVSKTAQESIPDIAVSLAGLCSGDYLDILEDYLTVTRKRQNNRMAMAKVQLHLVEEILVAQKSIKHYRQKLMELKAQGGAQPTDEKVNADIRSVERELFFHRAHANCFRAIGDGIAWRALKHDRAALRALSGNAVKQQILEQGTVNELHQWSTTFDTGQGLAILNALTNCLAIGDITVIKNDGAMEVVEVKSSNADSMTKQKQRMRAVTDLLKTGKGTLEGQDVEIVRFDMAVENDLTILFALLAELPDGTVVDGEIVALDESGRPNFNLLQNFRSEAQHIHYFIFDLLICRDRDLTRLPLGERRKLMKSHLKLNPGRVRIAEQFEVSANDMLAAVRQQKLEGVIGKRKDSLYEPGKRSGSWVKCRVNRGQEFVIGGYIPGPHGFDSLIVGYYHGKDLVYVARVRNGFVVASRRQVFEKIRHLVSPTMPFANLPDTHKSRWGDELTAEKMKECVWLRPQAVAQIEFLEWTAGDRLRHSKFVRLREDKDARQVVKERTRES